MRVLLGMLLMKTAVVVRSTTPPKPTLVWKYTTFYEGYETTAYDIKAGKNIYDTKAQAVKAIDKCADDLLINKNVSARRYGVQDWQVK